MTTPMTVVWLGTVPYRRAWAVQRRVAQARRRGELAADCLLLLEHEPVYTMGRTGTADHLRADVDRLLALGADYLEVDRGGSVTFHGPGQLIAYPVIDVAAAFPLSASSATGDVIRYIRALEAAVIETVAAYGVAAVARPPHTGAWVGEGPARKIAAIGVKVAGGVSTHGVALNVHTDLRWFDHIVPCGIAGAGVTSLEREGVAGTDVRTVSGAFTRALSRVLGRNPEAATAALVALVDEPAEAPPTAA